MAVRTVVPPPACMVTDACILHGHRFLFRMHDEEVSLATARTHALFPNRD